MLLAELAETSSQVAATPARSAKVALLAGTLGRADPAEIRVAVSYLSGTLTQRRTGLGYAALRDAPEPAGQASLTLLDADATFERIAALAGSGSATERRRLLTSLLARATAAEQHLLVGLIGGELRQGALEAVVADAVAKAAGLPPADVRRALMLRGALPAVAATALTEGAAGLAAIRLEVGRPVQPMLASAAPDLAAALGRVSPAALEWKLDGVRVQVHRTGSDIRVFTRTLDDVTARMPDVVAAVAELPVHTAVLDGEAIVLGPDGRPRPFQETSSRAASREHTGQLTAYFFDLLHLDGEDLLRASGVERHAALARIVPERLRIPRTVTSDDATAAGFLADALAHGHEGVVVKALDAAYDAGRRGAGWIKVKPRHTLDLVVLAAEWGHGRRRGWLSNLHLGARDPRSGGYVMLGKTFKGLTDAMLQEQTERLLELQVRSDGWVVEVRPELVVEVAFDGVQASTRYPGGMALRFARVLRHRWDKRADDPDAVDTVDAVRALHVR